MPFICEAVLFDVDGVLIDSRAVIERHWQRSATVHKIPFEKIEPIYRWPPSVDVIREVAPHLDAKAEARKKRDREATDTTGISILEGAQELLDGLPEEKWTIATSGTHRTATARRSHVDLPLPETLVTADDVDRGKPDPEPYQRPADRLGVDPGKYVVLEDASAGVASAQRAGSRVIGVAATTPSDALAAAEVAVRSLASLRISTSAKGALQVRWDEAGT